MYTPVYVYRCKCCGGENVIISEENPEGDRYKCKHHGLGGAADSTDFAQTGIGILGRDYAFREFYIVQDAPSRTVLEDAFSIETADEYDTMDLDDSVVYADYYESEIQGRPLSEIADERGVTPQTVSGNVKHTKKMFSQS